MSVPVNETRPRDPDAVAFFLPDFCAARATLAIVLIVELVAFVLAIARASSQSSFLVDLASLSLFLLWLGLSSSAVLCRSRQWLATMTTPRASAIALLMLLLTIAALAEIVFQIGRFWSRGLEGIGSIFPEDHADFLLRTVAIGFIVSALALRYFHVSAEWKRSIELEARSRIHALQARIRPHFLFNSMNTIASLTRSDPGRAEEAVEDLADLFRANLSDARARIPLKEELEVARIYQRIEQLRLGSRLQVRWDVADTPMRALVPSLLVQPLLENAVYHGIETLPAGGTVTVTGRFDGKMIELEVRNPLAPEVAGRERRGNRLALDNIRQRLDLAWPGQSRVEVNQEDGEYRVTLVFPYQEH
jgi:two-component system, LytTR family, sensor histidine kinase AlgZ